MVCSVPFTTNVNLSPVNGVPEKEALLTCLTDGSTKGPGVKFSGSLNNLQNDLVDRLQTAVNNIRSGASYQDQNTVQPDRTTPPNNNATPKPRNPFDSLFGK